MSTAILVAYATRYGSTQEVAQTIGEILVAAGFSVVVQSAHKVSSLTGYYAVVVGAPFYYGAWIKEGRGFLEKHREALTKLPVALFSLGPTQVNEMQALESQNQLEKLLGEFSWLAPVATGFFGGKYEPATLRFPDNLVAALPASPLHGTAASDVRNWPVIRTWATQLAGAWR